MTPRSIVSAGGAAIPLTRESISYHDRPGTQHIEVSVVGEIPEVMHMVQGLAPQNRLTNAMTLTTFERMLVDNPAPADWVLQGIGEPCLVPNLCGMIRVGTKAHKRITVDTNATLLYRDRAEEFVDARLHKLRVWLDGYTNYYEATAVADHVDFGPVLENLAGFRAAQRTAGTEVHVQAVYLLTKQNIHLLPDIVALLGGIWITDVEVRYPAVITQESDPDELLPRHTAKLNPDHVAQVFREASATADEYGVTLQLPALAKREPVHTSYITHEGTVQRCCAAR